jgi:hypothetical protein
VGNTSADDVSPRASTARRAKAAIET